MVACPLTALPSHRLREKARLNFPDEETAAPRADTLARLRGNKRPQAARPRSSSGARPSSSSQPASSSQLRSDDGGSVSGSGSEGEGEVQPPPALQAAPFSASQARKRDPVKRTASAPSLLPLKVVLWTLPFSPPALS